jgi:hypothetical protein
VGGVRGTVACHCAAIEYSSVVSVDVIVTPTFTTIFHTGVFIV